jgi:hypothetical protein
LANVVVVIVCLNHFAALIAMKSLNQFTIGFVILSGKLSNWTHTLSLWCLNPAVVFRDIADLSLSVVLTSG